MLLGILIYLRRTCCGDGDGRPISVLFHGGRTVNHGELRRQGRLIGWYGGSLSVPFGTGLHPVSTPHRNYQPL